MRDRHEKEKGNIILGSTYARMLIHSSSEIIEDISRSVRNIRKNNRYADK